MNKELNEDARTKQDLLYECNSLESKLSNEIIKNEHLEQQCKKQKEVIDKAIELINRMDKGCEEEGCSFVNLIEVIKINDILKGGK